MLERKKRNRRIVIGSIVMLVIVGAIVGISIYRHPIQHHVTFENVALVESFSIEVKEKQSGFQRDMATVTLDLTEYRTLFCPTVFEGTVTVNDREYPVNLPNNPNGIAEFFNDFLHNFNAKIREQRQNTFRIQSYTQPQYGYNDSVYIILHKDFEHFFLQETLVSDPLYLTNDYAYPAEKEQDVNSLYNTLY